MPLDNALEALSDRGVAFGRATGAANLAYLEDAFELRLGLELRSFYETIDGFNGADDQSQISIWNIRDVIANAARFGIEIIDGEKWLTVGDFLIESDVIAVSAEDNVSKVMYLNERRLLSESFESFLQAIAEGEYNIE